MKELNKVDIYHSVKNDKGIKVYFLYMPNCPFCKFAWLAVKYLGRKWSSKVKFYCLDANRENFWDENTELHINVVPTLLIYDNAEQKFFKDTFINPWVVNRNLAKLLSKDGQR